MSERNLCLLVVTPEYLADLIGLPLMASIRRIDWDTEREQAKILIHSPDLPEVPRGAPIPVSTPVITKTTDEWNWGIHPTPKGKK